MPSKIRVSLTIPWSSFTAITYLAQEKWNRLWEEAYPPISRQDVRLRPRSFTFVGARWLDGIFPVLRSKLLSVRRVNED